VEELLTRFASVAAVLSDAAAVIVVAYGSLEAFVKLVWIVVPWKCRGRA
jgi:hypothetical protein